VIAFAAGNGSSAPPRSNRRRGAAGSIHSTEWSTADHATSQVVPVPTRERA
jgi:hypothetical protein